MPREGEPHPRSAVLWGPSGLLPPSCRRGSRGPKRGGSRSARRVGSPGLLAPPPASIPSEVPAASASVSPAGQGLGAAGPLLQLQGQVSPDFAFRLRPGPGEGVFPRQTGVAAAPFKPQPRRWGPRCAQLLRRRERTRPAGQGPAATGRGLGRRQVRAWGEAGWAPCPESQEGSLSRRQGRGVEGVIHRGREGDGASGPPLTYTEQTPASWCPRAEGL